MQKMMINIKALLLIAALLLGGCHTFDNHIVTQDKKINAARLNVQLGMAYLERHEIQRSKQKLLLALQEAPHLPEAWYSLGYFFEVTGDNERASNCYLKALQLAPKRGDTNNNYGTYLCRKHQYNEAVKYFLKATQDMEYLDTAAAYENAGLCAELIPAPQQAKKYFELAIKQDPSRPLTILNLAQLNYKQGSYEQANAYLNQYLAVAEPSAESRLLIRQLERLGFR
ncbi:MAG TPA: type IV pilus biogenesis/stability protein PilW [Gammaproteobacteria bacterium]|nr:type IV pilus biogenesis/stability protein PilW [Gammaproteobacteria bacterium]